MTKKIKRKNNGKAFEEDFRESLPSYVWSYRPPDIGGGMLARFTNESLCDLIIFNTHSKDLSLIELKSTINTSVAFKDYDFCMNYEKEKEAFETWLDSLTPNERKTNKDLIKKRRGEVKLLYKETNKASIKYHQIKSLLENEANYGIKGYIVFTYIEQEKTYIVPIKSFESFWKVTTKKSINSKDIDELVSDGKAFILEQENKGRSKIRYTYDLSYLTGENHEE